MAGLKDIRRRIRSIESTKKITRAMKLVSAAKLRKAQEAVVMSREYDQALALLIREVLSDLSRQGLNHPLLLPHAEVKSVAYVVVGGSKGLCGAYNSNVHKRAQRLLAEQRAEHPEVSADCILLGRKPVEYFRRHQLPFSESYVELPANALQWPIEALCLELQQRFQSGKLDEVHMVYTRFFSAVSMQVTVEQLLPLSLRRESESSPAPAEAAAGITLFEPQVAEVLDEVVPRVLRTRLQQACLESSASEQGSRMSAMDAATNNATELIDKLRLFRNKLRQSGITGEILDIIGGSVAA